MSEAKHPADPPAEPSPNWLTTVQRYRYRGQTTDGRMLDGTIDAGDADDAHRKLADLGITVTDLGAGPRPRAKAISGDDFLAFNEQLAHLTAAGMPVERGLRLLAEDMRSGRLAQSVRGVADDLERGRSLPQAFEAHRDRFPRIYGRLMEAGIRTGNLPDLLLSLGRHLQMVARLRTTLWRAIAYPLLVFLTLTGVLIFISLFVMPGFEIIFADFETELPAITRHVFAASTWLPYVLGAFALCILLAPMIGLAAMRLGVDRRILEGLIEPLPLIGPVLKNNRIARWLDVLNIALAAGLDLPAAMELAGDAVRSPSLESDGKALTLALASGRPLSGVRRAAVPATVVAAMELAPRHGDLPGVLMDMSRMYEQQAELKLGTVEVVMAPVLLLGLMFIVGAVIVAMFLPLIVLIQSVSA